MQDENILENDKTATSLQPTTRSSRTNILIWLHGITFILGFGLLIYVVYRIGYQSILDSVSNVGWGFLIILGLNITRHFLRSASMYLAIEPELRTFKYRSAVAARFGGEAVTFFTFTGPFLGDATKAVLMKKDLPLTHGASAVIIDNILYYVTVILVVLAGVATLLVNYGSSGNAMTRVLLAIVLVAVVMFSCMMLALMYKVTPLTHAIGFLEKRRLAPKFLLKRRENILTVENNVFNFYHNRRRDFLTVFSISLGVHVVSVIEVLCALTFLGYQANVSTAFIIESLTKVINAVFGFIPGTIGVYEGGNELILRTLGYDLGVGVALGLVRRGAILFSTVIGIVILLWRGAASGARHLKSRSDNS
jgi:uncharacterized membrane protein YbhN (UPF0104 family)